jgi:hypothetical protein
MDLNLKASIISSFVELAITHPIDYLKTLKQNNTKNYISILKQNPYVGIKSKLYGNLPMRLIFWNSIEYGKNNNLSKLEASLLGATLQTLIDFPIEIYKINKMTNNKNKLKILPSFSYHYLRNIGFTITYSYVSNINPALAGLSGALLTQPLDCLKTHYQSGNINYPYQWKIYDYYKGGLFRCSISFISMGVGSYIFNILKD